MGKVLLVHFSTSEKGKIVNEDRASLELEKLFISNGYHVKKIHLETKKKLALKEQLKQEKNLELKDITPPLKGFDLVIIGTPIVGSLTSAPLVNVFIRNLPKQNNQSKPLFALFSVGVMHGFELKKMQSLLSMKGIKPIEAKAFTSIFDFDAKKLIEVKQFYEKIVEQINTTKN